MRKIIAALALSALALSAGSGAVARDKKSGEDQLAQMLKGRVPGTPVRCINTWRNNSMSILDGAAIVYRDGRTVYVNRTQNPKTLDDDDILVIKHFTGGGELCKLDHVTTIDRNGGFTTGVVFLTDFVPYTLPKDANG